MIYLFIFKLIILFIHQIISLKKITLFSYFGKYFLLFRENFIRLWKIFINYFMRILQVY